MTARRIPADNRTSPVIVAAEPDDIDVLSLVIADVFHPLAVSQWLIPDPQTRSNVFPGFFRIFTKHAIDTGTVLTTPAAPPSRCGSRSAWTARSRLARYETQLAAATGPWHTRFTELDTAFHQHHPGGLPHHHLAILAVRPDWQGQGIGTALLDAHHASLDAGGTPAYLTASGLDTRGLYLRHGYVLRPDAPIRLPDGPEMWPMWRQPQPGRDVP